MTGYAVLNDRRYVLTLRDEFMFVWQPDWRWAYIFTTRESAEKYMQDYGGVSLMTVTYTEE